MYIKWWQGTDLYVMYKFPPTNSLRWILQIIKNRIFWKIFHRRFTHWVNHPEQGNILRKIGISDYVVKENPDYNHSKYEKVQHDGYNILYYHPAHREQKYAKWIYGIDTLFMVMNRLSHDKAISWIRLDGTVNMAETLPIADCYIKINKHLGSGKNRIAKECEINGVPVIYTDYTKSDKENVEYIRRSIDELRKNASTT